MAYSIGEFARLSGITATTLRAWQRRYGLLKPERTDGGHRLYSDEDVQQALKILRSHVSAPGRPRPGDVAGRPWRSQRRGEPVAAGDE